MISALQHYSYCPRQCALIHMEQTFQENAHTLHGRAVHETVDRPESAVEDGVRVEYALSLYSEKLGLTGKADAVEFHAGDMPFPVEFKHGRKKATIHDDLQVVAQAMCLEEMTGKPVPVGAIYHFKSRRRREVKVTSELRQQVEGAAAAIRQMLIENTLPAPTDDVRKCKECSLRETCQPELGRKRAKIKAVANKLFVPEGDES